GLDGPQKGHRRQRHQRCARDVFEEVPSIHARFARHEYTRFRSLVGSGRNPRYPFSLSLGGSAVKRGGPPRFAPRAIGRFLHDPCIRRLAALKVPKIPHATWAAPLASSAAAPSAAETPGRWSP